MGSSGHADNRRYFFLLCSTSSRQQRRNFCSIHSTFNRSPNFPWGAHIEQAAQWPPDVTSGGVLSRKATIPLTAVIFTRTAWQCCPTDCCCIICRPNPLSPVALLHWECKGLCCKLAHRATEKKNVQGEVYPIYLFKSTGGLFNYQ